MFVTLAERRYARHACRKLLDLFWLERREHPKLSGRSLYQAVVARVSGRRPRAPLKSYSAPRRALPTGRWNAS